MNASGQETSYYDNYIVKPEAIDNLKAKFPNNTIICKGRLDVIINSEMVKYCNIQGAIKRAGGQGDILVNIICDSVWNNRNFFCLG